MLQKNMNLTQEELLRKVLKRAITSIVNQTKMTDRNLTGLNQFENTESAQRQVKEYLEWQSKSEENVIDSMLVDITAIMSK